MSLLLTVSRLQAEDAIKIIINNNIKEAYFIAEVAKKKEKREKGLMFRKKLSINQAMFFIFPFELKISMWMKNTLIPLDIIFISKNKKIVDIINNAKANSEHILTSKVKAKYVLEINSGLVKELEIKIGHYVSFEEIN